MSCVVSLADDGSMSADIEWLAGLSPWPADGFGLDRIKELLGLLGDPQLDYPAVHVAVSYTHLTLPTILLV